MGGDFLARGYDHRPRYAEVGDENMLLIQQNVWWLDVAMEHTILMRIIHGVCDVTRNRQCVGEWKLALASQPRSQRVSLDERHREVDHPFDGTEVEERQNVGMLQTAGDFDFAMKARFCYGGWEVGAKELQRDETVVTEVARQIYVSRPASANEALNGVALVQSSGEPLDRQDASVFLRVL
jgi:hypothetical protein